MDAALRAPPLTLVVPGPGSWRRPDRSLHKSACLQLFLFHTSRNICLSFQSTRVPHSSQKELPASRSPPHLLHVAGAGPGAGGAAVGSGGCGSNVTMLLGLDPWAPITTSRLASTRLCRMLQTSEAASTSMTLPSITERLNAISRTWPPRSVKPTRSLLLRK